MTKAFISVAEETEKAFGKTIPTIGQAFTVLKNRAIQAFGEFDKTYKVTETLSRGIIYLSENLDEVGKLLHNQKHKNALCFRRDLKGG